MYATARSTEKLAAHGVVIEYATRRGTTVAVDGLDVAIGDGEFVSIVGPSGCGKSTFLMAVAGLVPVASGEILLNGDPVKGPGDDRAVVFQDASLLPWRTVTGNIVYGLELREGRDRRHEREVVRRLIDTIGLTGFEDRYPHQLSGGMQQRVNLARALAVDPELMLLDEPFAALDAQTREAMQGELLRIWTEYRRTTVFVTHQIDEAVFLSDKVVVMSARPGRAVATIDVPFDRPRSLEIKRTPEFLGIESEIWDLIHQVEKDPAIGDDETAELSPSDR